MSTLNRRRFLRLAAAAAALPTAVLAACSRSVERSRSTATLPRPDDPVRWPVFDGTAPIASDLPIERAATLKVYEWRDYLAPWVIRDFERRYADHGVHVEVTSFENRDAAAARIGQPGNDQDVFFPTIDQLGDLVGAGLLRPLNHDYLPNRANLWPAFGAAGAPFYDLDQGYSVPYTVFSTGIGYRRDLVPPDESPAAIADGCAVFANPRFRGHAGVLDAYREPLAMVLQALGEADLNRADAGMLAKAADELIAFARITGLRATIDGSYEGLADGTFVVHQAWSGDVLAARRFASAPPARTDERMGYWWMRAGGVVGADLLAIPSAGRNPVLAHLFLNHLLDLDVAMRNFAWNGYQPPLTAATRAAFASDEWGRAVPAHLLDTAVLAPDDFDAGQMLLRLDPASDATWVDQWDRFRSATT